MYLVHRTRLLGMPIAMPIILGGRGVGHPPAISLIHSHYYIAITVSFLSQERGRRRRRRRKKNYQHCSLGRVVVVVGLSVVVALT